VAGLSRWRGGCGVVRRWLGVRARGLFRDVGRGVQAVPGAAGPGRFGALGRRREKNRRAGSGARRPVRGASAEASPVQRHPGRNGPRHQRRRCRPSRVCCAFARGGMCSRGRPRYVVPLPGVVCVIVRSATGRRAGRFGGDLSGLCELAGARLRFVLSRGTLGPPLSWSGFGGYAAVAA